MRKTISAFAGIALVLAFANSARALNARTWISSAGIDQAGCGPIGSPCRTLQFAHDNTSPGGEIDIKDSAGYGAVTITKAISIISDGQLGGVLAPAGGNGITIKVGATDLVVLRGLAIEGAGTGKRGIEMTSAGILNVSTCTVQRFEVGVLVAVPNNTLIDVTIQASDVSYNSLTGITISGSTISGSQTTILNSVVNHNGEYGISAYGSTTITDTKVTNHGTHGISTYYGTSILDNVTVTGSKYSGLHVNSGTFLLGRSTIVGNTRGVDLQYAGTALSYRNNQISGNGTDIANGTLQTAPLQ